MKKILKEVLNAAWKVSVVLIGVFAILLALRIGQLLYRDYFGREKWNDKTLSCDVVVKAYSRDRYRVYNKKTKLYTTPKLRFVSGAPKRDSLTVFCDMDGYRGFLNVNTGEIVIPAQYGKAWQFSDGLAAVIYGDKNRLGFIDHNNELVIKDIPHDPGYYDYMFKDGFCVIESWDDINDENIYSVYSSKKLGKIGEYKKLTNIDDNNHIIAKDNKGYWLLDREYNKVFDSPYEKLEEAYGINGVFVTGNWVKQLVDYDGNVLEPFVIDGTYRLSYVSGITDPYYELDGEYYNQANIKEFEPDIMVYFVNDNQGLMNPNTGKIITLAKYGDISMISKNLIRAEVNELNIESVLLDRHGNEMKIITKE